MCSLTVSNFGSRFVFVLRVLLVSLAFSMCSACSTQEKKSEAQIQREWIIKQQYSWGVSSEYANTGVRGFANKAASAVKSVIVENAILGFLLVLLWSIFEQIVMLFILLQDLFHFQLFGMPCIVIESVIVSPLQLFGGCFGVYF